ncbi:MAG TPA: endolytic transglycosylase MltG [Nitrospiraceae bacterium]|jgi:UPF0755 protein|nr:endolytic transglycosylase MltG [Nitrospiraceae bacterium]
MTKNLTLVVVFLVFIFLLYAAVELLMPLPFGNKSIEFEIKRGVTFRHVVEDLSQKGMVRDKWVFFLAGRITGIDRRIKAGYYPLWGTMSPLQIFNAIRLGKIIEYEITVVPGDSLREIAQKFAALGIIDQEGFFALCTSREMLDENEVDAPSLEGYLFPDTYRFPKGLEAKEILPLMINRLREFYDEAMMSQMLELNISERDMLTMASIIEKEAITDDERPIIAAVYYNRLRRNMPLQADPTAIYGVKGSNERITIADLKRKTPYNTYNIMGLPPGPIASPGLPSIIAALNPAHVPYLYFVSNNDGTHTFSSTWNEHAEAVKVYRDKMKAKG